MYLNYRKLKQILFKFLHCFHMTLGYSENSRSCEIISNLLPEDDTNARIKSIDLIG